MLNGPSWSMWTVLAGVAWVVATVLVVYDTATYDGDGMGPLTPFGGLIALVAVALTLVGVLRRVQDEILSQMHRAFTMGRESVTGIQRR